MTLTSEVNLGGNIPRAVNDTVAVPGLARPALEAMQYFAAVRSVDSYNAGDSREMGKLSFMKLHPLRRRPEELRAAVTKMIARNDAMRDFQTKYDFLAEILCTIIRNTITNVGSSSNKVTPTSAALTGSKVTNEQNTISNTFALILGPSKITSRADTLTESEAMKIACKFPLLLLSNVTSDAAVDEWILSWPALRDLDEEFSWFKPMIEGIAEELLAQTPFGVKLRAYGGAAMSMLDMASDTYVVIDMMNAERVLLATALLTMIAANILIQLIIVWAQNRTVERKNNGLLTLREGLYVVTFIKPGVDAFRLTSGQEQLPGSVFSPLEEMGYSKAVELFAEAVPGMTLQCIALITSKKKSQAALASIAISAGCAALTSTSIFYDIDTDPAKRRELPDVWGMIPNTGRGMAFAVIFSFSALQIVAKCISVALLAVTNVQWLKLYLGGDMLLYLLLKTLRRDYIFFAPVPFSAAIAVSLLARVVEKTVVDFTGCMALRTPYFAGGAYFSFNLVVSAVSVPIATHLYLEHMEVKDEGAEKISAAVLWPVIIGMLVLWVGLFGFFLLKVVVPEYRETFWSILTGWRRAENQFLDEDEDEKRALIFKRSVFLWSRIKEDVKSWTMGSWETWDREKPEWFTPMVIASIPDEFIPPRFLSKLGGARERRGSAVDSVRRMSLKGVPDPEADLTIEEPIDS
jgi:hypothetical protein